MAAGSGESSLRSPAGREAHSRLNSPEPFRENVTVSQSSHSSS